MYSRNSWVLLGFTIIAFTTLALSGCGKKEAPLNSGGSTFVHPMMSLWSSEFEKAKGFRVVYDANGSSEGIRQMIDGTLDFGCTDAPLDEAQLEEARARRGEVIHVPLAMGAVVMAYNLKELKEPLRLNGQAIANIYLGRIKKWNDPSLCALNPGVDLPAKPIFPVHRTDGSGTTYVFTDYLTKVSPRWEALVGRGLSVPWALAEGARGNSAVMTHVQVTDGGIGYMELDYAIEGGLSYALVENREGSFVKPTRASITAAGATLTNPPEDLRFSLTNAPGKHSYPISGTTFAVLYARQDESRRQRIAEFLRWATREGQQQCASLNYVALPPVLLPGVERQLNKLNAPK